jgi:murein DD-endopeptidase MepM/ murein hydrolase activator NlpD
MTLRHALLASALLTAGSGCAQARPADPPEVGTVVSDPARARIPRPPQLPPTQRPRPALEQATFLPASVSQGALVMGRAAPNAVVAVEGRRVRVSPDGRFVFGVGRDAVGPLSVRVTKSSGSVLTNRIAVTPRDWPIERIDGVPPTTVNPPPDIAARIEREQALVVAARARDDARTDFEQIFIWPVQGRISGRFGNQRIYNGTPKSPHSGMDIAAANGTPVKAPAAGVITFAAPDLYLTGGTVVLDHGQGVSSNFLHLSRIDVKVGDRVEQGQLIGAVGATGRATGPHLHWGMNWFDVRIDPLLVLERGPD